MTRSTGFLKNLNGTTALVAVALLVAPIQAEAADVIVNSAEVTRKTLINDDDLIVTISGSVTDNPSVDISAGVAASSIDNDGGLNASTAASIFIDNAGLTGDLINTGSIDASLDTPTDYLLNGIYMNVGTIGGALRNSGDINASVSGTNTSDTTITQTANAIFITGATTIGSLINMSTGTISAISDLDNYDYSFTYSNSIQALSGSSIGSLINKFGATISAISSAKSAEVINNGMADDGASAYASNILFSNSNIVGALTNAGLIESQANVEGSSSAKASAQNILLTNGSNIGSFTNESSGVISAISNADGGSFTVGGVYASNISLNNSNIIGALNNEGTISASTNVLGSRYNYLGSSGISFFSSSLGDLYNFSDAIISAKSFSKDTADSNSAYALAINLSGSDITGVLYNAGTVSARTDVSSNDDAKAYASGIGLGANSVIGSFVNELSGEISATSYTEGVTQSGSATATGIFLNSSDITAGLSNTGTISALADGIANNDVRVFTKGIGLYTNSIIDSFDNELSGEILAVSSAEGGMGTGAAIVGATGIYLTNSSITGALNNAGTILAYGSGTSNVQGYVYILGINLRANSTVGSLVNEFGGKISLTSNSVGINNTGSATATAIRLDNSDITGALVNAGTIEVNTEGRGTNAYGNAFGISATNSSVVDSVTNASTGNISVNSYVDVPSVGFYGFSYTGGISISSADITGDLDNFGNINVTSEAYNDMNASTVSAYANGVSVFAANIGGSLNNTGTINAEATASSGANTARAYTYGLRISSAFTNITNDLTNDGTISALATATDVMTTGTALAHGLSVQAGADIFGGIINNGSISGIATGKSSSEGVGINVDASQVNAGITNTGTIEGSSRAIQLTGLIGATPLFLNGGRVIGDIFDDTIANGFSDTTIDGVFNTEGDITVSSITVNNNADFTMSSGDSITLNTSLTNDGTFRGAGSIIGDVINNGTIVPGYSIGTQNITGNFVQSPTGRLEIELDGTTKASDLLNITGTATLDGTVNFSAYNGGFAVGDVFTFIQTGGGVAGTFSTVTEDLLFVDVGNVQTVGNDVQVEVLGRTSYGSVANNADQRSVANALDSLVGAGLAGGVDGIFNNLASTEEAARLLNSQSGIVHINAINSTNTAMRKVTNIIRSRTRPSSHNVTKNHFLRSQSYEVSSPQSYAAISPASGRGSYKKTNGKARDDYLLDDLRHIPEEAIEGPESDQRESYQSPVSIIPLNDNPETAWIEATAGGGSVDSDGIASGYKYNGYGIAAGIERENPDRDLKLGAFGAISYTSNDVKSLADSSAVTIYQGGVYASKDLSDRFHLNGSSSAALLSFDTKRPTAVGDIKGDYIGYGLFGYGEALYDYPINNKLTLSPYGDIEASVIGHESYTETGNSNLTMKVGSTTTPQLSSEIGMKVSGKFTHSNWQISPSVKAGWSHDYLDTSTHLTSKFSSAPSVSFNSKGPDRDRDAAEITLDLSVAKSEDSYLNFYTEYNASLSKGAQDHNLIGGIQIKW